MKLNFGYRPFSAIRKRLKGRVRTIKIRSYVLVLLTALVPVSLLFVFSYTQISKLVVENAITLAETLRDARAERIRLSITNTYANVVSSATHILDSGTLTGFNAPDTVKPLTELLESEGVIERVTIYDSFFEPLAAADREGAIAESSIYEQIRVKLMDIRFESDTAIYELDLENANSRLILFGRLTAGSRVRGYVTAIYDYREIKPLVSTPAGLISIYNTRYQRIGDSFGLSKLDKTINPLTERMLDGYTETVQTESEIHAYGFIDFETAELFIDVSIPLDFGATELSSLIVTFIFFLVATAIFATAIAWVHVRSIISYGESILVRTRFAREMRLFTRFAATLESVQGGMQAYSDMQTHISNLKRDVTTILSELPREESDDEA